MRHFWDIFLISVGDKARQQAMVLQRDMVRQGLNVLIHMGDGSIKNQFKKADNSRAALALLIGEDEAEEASVSIKNLRQRGQQGDSQQQRIAQNMAIDAVTKILKQI